MPAETVLAVDPCVVSMLDPEMLNEEPTLEAVDLAASTVNCTLAACLVTNPPALAAEAVANIITKGINLRIFPWMNSLSICRSGKHYNTGSVSHTSCKVCIMLKNTVAFGDHTIKLAY